MTPHSFFFWIDLDDPVDPPVQDHPVSFPFKLLFDFGSSEVLKIERFLFQNEKNLWTEVAWMIH